MANGRRRDEGCSTHQLKSDSIKFASNARISSVGWKSQLMTVRSIIIAKSSLVPLNPTYAHAGHTGGTFQQRCRYKYDIDPMDQPVRADYFVRRKLGTNVPATQSLKGRYAHETDKRSVYTGHRSDRWYR
jgi:hypothetical protein